MRTSNLGRLAGQFTSSPSPAEVSLNYQEQLRITSYLGDNRHMPRGLFHTGGPDLGDQGLLDEYIMLR